MSAAIWKYPMVGPVQKIDLPAPARFLSCGVQGAPPNEQIVLWFLVADETDPNRPNRITVHALNTGAGLDDRFLLLDFLGTVQCGTVVWHLFCDGRVMR